MRWDWGLLSCCRIDSLSTVTKRQIVPYGTMLGMVEITGYEQFLEPKRHLYLAAGAFALFVLAGLAGFDSLMAMALGLFLLFLAVGLVLGYVKNRRPQGNPKVDETESDWK